MQYNWLSDWKPFTSDGKIDCSKDECSVIRYFYDENGKAKFNYATDEKIYNKGLLRTKYSGLVIEKTVDNGDNNVICIGEELKYNVKITNRSDSVNLIIDENGIVKNGKGKKYNKFKVIEKIGNNVKYVSSNNNGQYDEKQRTITWTVDSLEVLKSIDLEYCVIVEKGDEVISTGKFYSDNVNIFIETGTVNNKVVIKPTPNNENTVTYKNSFKYCYNEKKNEFNSLELIDEIYKCAIGYDLNLREKFKSNKHFENLILHNRTKEGKLIIDDDEYIKSDKNDKEFYHKISLKNPDLDNRKYTYASTEFNDKYYKNIRKMILNNY